MLLQEEHYLLTVLFLSLVNPFFHSLLYYCKEQNRKSKIGIKKGNVTSFTVFQRENLEKSWLNWSGAREIYKYSPSNWNLRRISLHRISNIRLAIDYQLLKSKEKNVNYYF